MKNLYILSMAFFVALSVSAQEGNETLLNESRTWTICSWTSPQQPDTKLYYEYVLRGDTTINDIRFKQSFQRRVDGKDGGDFRPSLWVGQNGDKCYVATFESGKSNDILDLQMSMDFGLKVGDTYQQKDMTGFCLNYEVTSVGDTVVDSSTDKTTRKVIHLKCMNYPDDSRFHEVWVEGIGSLSEGSFGAYNKTATGQLTQTVKCTEGAETLIDQLVASAISTVMKSETKYTDKMFNLQGQQLNGLATKGVVVRKGKKYVSR